MAHIKYVEEQDLFQLGMSKPEVRRLRKYYEKHYPQNYFAKIIKVVGFLTSELVVFVKTRKYFFLLPPIFSPNFFAESTFQRR